MNKKLFVVLSVTAAVVLAVYYLNNRDATPRGALRIGIAPYQDIAMIVNAVPLGLEKKYGTALELRTMKWEDILPALSSNGETIDVGFGSLIEYLTEAPKINAGVKDSLLFIYPAYIFKGGGFITFDSRVPALTPVTVRDSALVHAFFSYRIGAQKNSVYEMMLYSLATRAGFEFNSASVLDATLDNGILATRKGGSLDIAAAGLTQIAEARKQGGRVVLTMEDLGFADVTGFVCRKSTLIKRRSDIENLIRIWYKCVSYVMTDVDRNSTYSLKYLQENAATKYTLPQYKEALSQEYFPRSVLEANAQIVNDTGRFGYRRIAADILGFRSHSQGKVQTSPQDASAQFIEIRP